MNLRNNVPNFTPFVFNSEAVLEFSKFVLGASFVLGGLVVVTRGLMEAPDRLKRRKMRKDAELLDRMSEIPSTEAAKLLCNSGGIYAPWDSPEAQNDREILDGILSATDNSLMAKHDSIACISESESLE